MMCNCLHQPFLLSTTFHYFLPTVHYFLCALSAKMANYSLVIDNVYLVISSKVYYSSETCLKTLE